MNRNNSNKQENEPFSFWESLKEYKNLIIGFIAVNMLAYIAVPLILTCKKISFVSYKGVGEIGDTIGGTVGPIIAIIAAILTFVAYLEQIKLNREQMKQFSEQEKQFKEQIELQKTQFNQSLEEQRAIAQKERFNSHFFELCNILRNNSEELMIKRNFSGEKNGTPVFSEIIDFIKEKLKLPFLNKTLSNLEKGQCYFDYIIYNDLKDYLEDKSWGIKEVRNFQQQNQKSVIPKPNQIKGFNQYFKTFLTILKYIINYPTSILSDNEKFEYITILFTQISQEQQFILLLNSLGSKGKPWLDNEYITKWRICKNISKETLVKEFKIDLKELYSTLGVSEDGRYLGEGVFQGEYIFEFAEEDAKNKQNESK